ncbi:hypothetical protein HBB16_04400 [Pseudonocardia sp. MCCB 268]|nr:hypothetical protein [Pseudonocardia cytotoxica]
MRDTRRDLTDTRSTLLARLASVSGGGASDHGALRAGRRRPIRSTTTTPAVMLRYSQRLGHVHDDRYYTEAETDTSPPGSSRDRPHRTLWPT